MNVHETPEPIWQSLLGQAFELIDHAEKVVDQPIEWSFGGGTVLMLLDPPAATHSGSGTVPG